MRVLLVVFLMCTPVMAKDYMVVLNEQELAAMRELLDAAVRASGLHGNATRNAVILMDKINAAPEVVERKDGTTPEVPK